METGQNWAKLVISANDPFLRKTGQFCSYSHFSITNTRILLDIYSANKSPFSHAHSAVFTAKIKPSLVEKLYPKAL